VIRDFPDGPVVKTQSFQCRGPELDSWSRNLRSHKPLDVSKKKKKKDEKEKSTTYNCPPKNTRSLPYLSKLISYWFLHASFTLYVSPILYANPTIAHGGAFGLACLTCPWYPPPKLDIP